VYKHKLVQGLDLIINKYAGRTNDPIMKAIWFGIKGQVPVILKTIDDNPGLVEEMRQAILEYLEPEKPIEMLEEPTFEDQFKIEEQRIAEAEENALAEEESGKPEEPEAITEASATIEVEEVEETPEKEPEDAGS